MDFDEAIGLDVGEKRVGIARISAIAKLPEPIETQAYAPDMTAQIKALMREFEADVVVVGLPRSLSGDETLQTLFSRQFADTLKAANIAVVLQDEAMTSKQAEALIKKGVYKKNARGQDVTIDEVAACLILEDFAGVAR